MSKSKNNEEDKKNLPAKSKPTQNSSNPDRYNWFKGQAHPENNKNWKESLKIVWKFTRIFAIFSLLFFSLYGCVQSFVFQTEKSVGRGIELFVKESSINPHMTELKKVDGLTQNYSAKDIYYPSNIETWIEDKDQLNSIHETVRNQSANKDLKLSDAYQGANEAVIMNTTAGYQVLGDGITKWVLSSEATNFNKDVSIPVSTFINVGKQSVNFYKFNNTGDLELIGGNTIEFKVATSEKEKARQDYKYQILSFSGALDWLQKDQLTEVNYSAQSNTEKDKTKAEVIRVQSSVVSILNFLGFSADQKGNYIENTNWLPGMGDGKTNYRPMVTWEHAWVRGVGPFYGLFIFPISKLVVAMRESFPLLNGWETFLTIAFSVVILKILTFLISFKSTLQQSLMQQLTAKKALIDAKYEPYKDNKQMKMRHSQEVRELYSKAGISIFSQFSGAIMSMPIFLSMWRVISSVPHFKSSVWLGINFTSESYKELFAGNPLYLPVMIFAVATSLGSQIYSRWLPKRRDKNKINVQQKAAMKKANKTQNILMIVFTFIPLLFTAGIQIYSIISSVWMIIQTTISYYMINYIHKRRKDKGIKLVSSVK